MVLCSLCWLMWSALIPFEEEIAVPFFLSLFSCLFSCLLCEPSLLPLPTILPILTYFTCWSSSWGGVSEYQLEDQLGSTYMIRYIHMHVYCSSHLSHSVYDWASLYMYRTLKHINSNHVSHGCFDNQPSSGRMFAKQPLNGLAAATLAATS